jgi:lysophospholipase L1-like esterase
MKSLLLTLRRAALAACFAFSTVMVVSAAEPVASADWSAAMAEFATQDATAPSAPGCVLFLGSSSIRMWKTLKEDFPGVPVVNRGFGGSQIADVLVHFDRLVLPHHPRLIVFYSGTNDVSAGKSPEQVVKDFELFCAKVHAVRPETRILFVSLQYAPSRWALRAKMAAANAEIANYCAADPRRSYVDTNPAMLAASGSPDETLYSPDRLHMAPGGYAVWTKLLAPLVK